MPTGKVYRTGTGYATASSREDWLRAHDKDRKAIPESLVADRDPSAPLYPWQLHSILGPKRIEALVTCFYQKVFDDDDEWFSGVFKRVTPDVEHHVMTQTAFWIDAMGGGRVYHGGDYRLNFHHTHNAESIMNARGAKRWMFHMRQAVKEQDYSKLDPRVKGVIMDFLRVKMMKYARDHGWQFDDSDFALEGVVDGPPAPATPNMSASSGSSGGGSVTLDPDFVEVMLSQTTP